MIVKETLRKIVKSQRRDLFIKDKEINREKLEKVKPVKGFAFILSGVRRCGKSTLLKQLMKKTKKFYYFNFEDPRAVDFDLNDFQKLDEVFIEEFGQNGCYFFDEIQNVEKWELFVRALLDKKRYVIITGSNASLLSKELGTRLTGRHLREEIFPFSFKEFLKLNNKSSSLNSFREYFVKGGFPEYLKLQKAELLQELLNDIVVRDISVRYNVKNLKTLKEIALYLLSNTGKEFSYNSLKKMFELGSTNSVISFISHFEDSYLLFTIPKFDYSMKKQLVNPKKIYSIDNGLSNVNSTSFSEDKGKMLENLVFINLRKQYKDIFYFQEEQECDFVVKEKTKITQAIQVCYEINEENKKREIDGLIKAMDKFKLKQGLILTYNQEDKLKIQNKNIVLKPVWKWLV